MSYESYLLSLLDFDIHSLEHLACCLWIDESYILEYERFFYTFELPFS